MFRVLFVLTICLTLLSAVQKSPIDLSHAHTTYDIVYSQDLSSQLTMEVVEAECTEETTHEFESLLLVLLSLQSVDDFRPLSLSQFLEVDVYLTIDIIKDHYLRGPPVLS